MKYVLALILMVGSVYGEEELYSVGALPPIGNSLNAPIQIDEKNTHAQEQFLTSSNERARKLLSTKRFPIEILLAIFGVAFAILVASRIKPQPKIVEKPSLTNEERYQLAQSILLNAQDVLTNEEAMSLFSLLDPIADTFTEQEHYFSIAEQVKFAGVPLKREDLAVVLR